VLADQVSVIVDDQVRIVDLAVAFAAFVDPDNNVDVVGLGRLADPVDFRRRNSNRAPVQPLVPFAALDRCHDPVPVRIAGYKHFGKGDELRAV
jgi:hypothetical protein